MSEFDIDPEEFFSRQASIPSLEQILVQVFKINSAPKTHRICAIGGNPPCYAILAQGNDLGSIVLRDLLSGGNELALYEQEKVALGEIYSTNGKLLEVTIRSRKTGRGLKCRFPNDLVLPSKGARWAFKVAQQCATLAEEYI